MKSVSTEVCEVHISADVCHIFCEWASVCVFVFDDALLSASLECVCSCQGVEEMQVWLSVGIHVSVCVCVWIENPECACVWVSGKLGIRTASYECSEASLGATGGSVREKHNLLLCFVIFTLILSQVIALATQIHLSWLQSLSIFIFGEYDREKWKAEANANVGE